MKFQTLFVPTDFSEAADNSANYAIALAQELKASVILYHAYHIPVPTPEMPIMVISPQQLEKDNLQRLDHLRNKLLKKSGAKVHIECVCSPGFAADEITDISEARKADLIVMGISGSGPFAHALLGSVTTNMLRKISTPLLIVPEKAKFKGLSKIAFACDYEFGISPKTISKLKDFVKIFRAHLLVVGIREPQGELTATSINDGHFLEMELHGIPHSVFSPMNSDVTAGLLEFEDSHKVDLLVMVPRKHSFFSRIFHASNTKEMVFHSHTPILALRE
ncbi:MAG TPA: universal stress protein [Bacteroidia bacterium]|jgi:nucleotide-binding universal stress UspA family protein|nr:universal stress protein [Bacteroidia bacterium]